jgi:hypothetical protein
VSLKKVIVQGDRIGYLVFSGGDKNHQFFWGVFDMDFFPLYGVLNSPC